jgi:8-oxo-dGTP diphosphatase
MKNVRKIKVSMKTINVVAAIIKKDNKVFITERGHGEFKCKWEFPGGKIEPGESGEEATIREIKEELKADIEVEKFFSEINDNRGDICFNVKFYICKLKSDKMEVTEHPDYKWVEPKDIIASDFMEADKDILNKLKTDYEHR